MIYEHNLSFVIHKIRNRQLKILSEQKYIRPLMLREWAEGESGGVVTGIGEGGHDELQFAEQVLAVHLVEPHL